MPDGTTRHDAVIACDKRKAFAQESVSDEAIHSAFSPTDCFASVAMTSGRIASHYKGSLLPVLLPHLGLDLRHAGYPAIIILGLLAHVAEHLRMRQDQKCL